MIPFNFISFVFVVDGMLRVEIFSLTLAGFVVLSAFLLLPMIVVFRCHHLEDRVERPGLDACSL